MGLLVSSIWSKQLIELKVLSSGVVTYWLIGVRPEELGKEGAPLFLDSLCGASWDMGHNPRPSVVFHVTVSKAARHRQLRWGDEYAHFFYIDAFAGQAAADLGMSLHALEEVEQPNGAEPARVIKLPTRYWY